MKPAAVMNHSTLEGVVDHRMNHINKLRVMNFSRYDCLNLHWFRMLHFTITTKYVLYVVQRRSLFNKFDKSIKLSIWLTKKKKKNLEMYKVDILISFI